MTVYNSKLDWVKSISKEELEKRFKEAKTLAKTAKNKISFYEKELERRKQELPLGVPIELTEGIEKGFYLQPALSVSCGNIGAGSMLDKALSVFHSKESAEKHAKMLLDWRKDGLVANSKGEPIDIKVLSPLLRKGKVCYSPELGWAWCSNDGKITCGKDRWYSTGENWLLNAFNLKPADDWRNSLMECGL